MAVVVSVCKGAVIGNIGNISIQEAAETHAYSYFQVNRPRGRGARPCAPMTPASSLPLDRYIRQATPLIPRAIIIPNIRIAQ